MGTAHNVMSSGAFQGSDPMGRTQGNAIEASISLIELNEDLTTAASADCARYVKRR